MVAEASAGAIMALVGVVLTRRNLSLSEEAIRENETEDGLLEGEKLRVGKLVDHPEIMSQGAPLRELEENLADACRLMLLDDVPDNNEAREKETCVSFPRRRESRILFGGRIRG